jgi:hypothetical protein
VNDDFIITDVGMSQGDIMMRTITDRSTNDDKVLNLTDMMMMGFPVKELICHLSKMNPGLIGDERKNEIITAIKQTAVENIEMIGEYDLSIM